MQKHHPQLAFEPLYAQSAFQAKALAQLLRYLQAHSPFYKKLFDKHHINIHNIKSVKDLRFIPTTLKTDMQDRNWEFQCVPDLQIREYASASGAMGKPVTIALTENDILRLTLSAYDSYLCTGGKPEDTCQLMLTLGRQLMEGLSCYMGLRQMGARIIRTGKVRPETQWDAIFRLQPNTVISVPSYIHALIKWAQQHNVDLRHSPVQKALCIGENIRGGDFELNALGQTINDAWPIKLHSIYTSTEMQTMFTECSAGMGCHQQPDMIITEVLNEHGDPLPSGEYGELAITTLGVEGMPLLRYRTGDICTYYDSICSCGRHSRRLSPILGRKQQMIKYKGVTIYPSAISDILNRASCINSYAIEAYTDAMALDNIIIHINTSLPHEECRKKLEPLLRAKLFSMPQLQFHSESSLHDLLHAGSLDGSNFIDHREQQYIL